jgi:hypothetical protein
MQHWFTTDRDPADRADLERWARHLAVLGAGTELGDVPSAPPESALRPARRGVFCASPGGEILLWSAVLSGAGLDALLATGIRWENEGPLWSRDDWSAIEVWTEAELCSLHALFRAGRTAAASGEAGWAEAVRRRIESAIAWHLEYTQPDNATNRPWATHAFLVVGGSVDRGAARMYAETLVHNTQAQASADPTCRWILADAARELRLALDAAPRQAIDDTIGRR